MTITRLKPTKCPACGYEIDGATGVEKGTTPRPGDISLCVYCGAISIYTRGMGIRSATAFEESRLLASKIGPKLLWARAEIRKAGPLRAK